MNGISRQFRPGSVPAVLCVAILQLAVGPSDSLLAAEGKKSDAQVASEQIPQLASRVAWQRQRAAEALAEASDARIVPALRGRLKHEADFHARLAIHYALAAQGEKSSIPELIAALRQTGHLGVVYLESVSGKGYGWDAAQWQAWDKRTSADVFGRQAREKLAGRPAAEEYQRFAALFSAQHLGRPGPDGTFQPPAADDKQLMEALPTAQAWNKFESALRALQDAGDRPLAATLFREVATQYMATVYARQARELADELDKLVNEDQAWKEPDDPAALALPERVAYHVYHLRDVVARQWSQPGYCTVLPGRRLADEKNDAAVALRDLGEAAVPALLALLDDRRPIRGVGYWRNFVPSRTVLRYQDAAVQILAEVLPGAPYAPRTTSSYFSTLDADERDELVGGLRALWQRDKDKSSLERRWAWVDDLGIYPALKLLGELAAEPGEKAQVLKKLHEMYGRRHWVYQPAIAEALAQLGDTSKVSEVVGHYRAGRYSKYSIQRPDDSGASLNAEAAANRLAAKYAPAAKKAAPPRPAGRS